MGKYNYHSHTFRCGHASSSPDSSYIDEALKNGYTKYGITDHVPVHPIFFWDSTVRMHDLDYPEYLESIEHLKSLYKGSIDIYSGFEAEYDEILDAYLCELRDKCDYMIMGQHYVLGKDIRRTSAYPIEYAKKVCAGIESGIFDIVAHPDIFMLYRFGLGMEEQNKFLYNAVVAAKMICEKAMEYGVPLELNLGATYTFDSKRIKELDVDYYVESEESQIEYLASNARYPTRLFWEIAGAVGNDVVVGIDAHYPEEIGLREDKLRKVGRYLDLSKLKFLPDTYDPVTARLENVKLQEAYQNTKNNLSSVEGRLVESCLNESIETDEDVSKFKERTMLARKLREEPPVRKYKGFADVDLFTKEKREELIKVIKDNSKNNFGKSMSKSEYISSLKKDIDYHYGVRRAVIDIDRAGNIISLTRNNMFYK